MNKVFVISKRNMESLLSKLDSSDSQFTPEIFLKDYSLVVPKNHPDLIAKGTNSLVFKLPSINHNGKKEYMVGKIFKYADSSTFEGIPEDVYHAFGRQYGLIAYGLPMTIYWLKQIEPLLDIPEMQEYEGKFNGVYINYTIMSDLKQGGQYQVKEVKNSSLKKIINGEDLRKYHIDISRRIADEIHKRDLILRPAGHGSEEDILPAIKHMFLVKYDDTLFGKLIAADLNHLAIYEKGYQLGTYPECLKKPKTFSRDK